jgi:AhpD family alkylhydroperoxidase
MTSRLNYFETSPLAAQKLMDLSQALQKSSLEVSLKDLGNIRASQINGCAFCLDMHVKEAKIHGERELRVYHVSIWRESPLFSEKERTAFEWTEALTQLSGHGTSDELYAKVREHFSDAEISDLTLSIGLINMWNRLNAAFRNTPGSLDAMFGLTKAGLK